MNAKGSETYLREMKALKTVLQQQFTWDDDPHNKFLESEKILTCTEYPLESFQPNGREQGHTTTAARDHQRPPSRSRTPHRAFYPLNLAASKASEALSISIATPFLSQPVPKIDAYSCISLCMTRHAHAVATTY